jgi:hypothetical protein
VRMECAMGYARNASVKVMDRDRLSRRREFVVWMENETCG